MCRPQLANLYELSQSHLSVPHPLRSTSLLGLPFEPHAYVPVCFTATTSMFMYG